MIELATWTVAATAIAIAFFVAGWRAHRWHILSFSRWPRRPSTKPSKRRDRSLVLTTRPRR